MARVKEFKAMKADDAVKAAPAPVKAPAPVEERPQVSVAAVKLAWRLFGPESSIAFAGAEMPAFAEMQEWARRQAQLHQAKPPAAPQG